MGSTKEHEELQDWEVLSEKTFSSWVDVEDWDKETLSNSQLLSQFHFNCTDDSNNDDRTSVSSHGYSEEYFGLLSRCNSLSSLLSSWSCGTCSKVVQQSKTPKDDTCIPAVVKSSVETREQDLIPYFKDYRARHWGGVHRFAHSHGHTMRRRRESLTQLSKEQNILQVVSRSEPQHSCPPRSKEDDLIVPVSAFDLVWGVPKTFQPSYSGPCTSETINLNKQRAWELVPELLAELVDETQSLSTQKAKTHHLDEVSNTTTFQLDAVGYLKHLPDLDFQRKAKRHPDTRRQKSVPSFNQVDVFELTQGRGWSKLKFVYRDEYVPPPGVAYPLLPGKIKTRFPTINPNFKNAWVNQGLHNNVWLPTKECEATGKSFLEVEFSVPCVVTAVGTKGRAPLTFWQSHKSCNREENFSAEKYNGKSVRVLAHRTQAWVARYELLCWIRNDNKWHSLGILSGNKDAVSEVTHSLAKHAMPGWPGVVVNKLRFRPLSEQEGGFVLQKAMRVGVYGYQLTGTTSKVSGVGGKSRRNKTGNENPSQVSEGIAACGPLKKTSKKCNKGEGKGSAVQIEYQLKSLPSESLNKKFTKNAHGHGYRCCCGYCRDTLGRSGKKKVFNRQIYDALKCDMEV